MSRRSLPGVVYRVAVDALMTLEFLGDATNVVLVGPNGVGKPMLAQNIAHQALIEGLERMPHAQGCAIHLGPHAPDLFRPGLV